MANAFFIGLLAFIVIGLAFFEHGVNDACQFMGGGDGGMGATMLGALPLIESAECAVGAGERLGGLAKGEVGRTEHLWRRAIEDFAARDLVVGRQPSGKVLDRGPPRHIRPDFSENRLGEDGAHTLNGS